MTRRADRFVIHFAILFLTVLLAMFGLYHVMDRYQGAAGEGGTVLNLSEAFRVNLFLIDLSIVLVIESLVILLFVRYTVPALIVSSAVVLVLAAIGPHVFGYESITIFLAPFARNEYAALGLRHVVLLFALNALLLAFLVAMMHHYQELDAHREAGAGDAPEGMEGQGPDRGQGSA